MIHDFIQFNVQPRPFDPLPVDAVTRINPSNPKPPEPVIEPVKPDPILNMPDVQMPRPTPTPPTATPDERISSGLEVVDVAVEIPSVEVGVTGFPRGTFRPMEVDIPPQPTRKYSPSYPFSARREGLSGFVLVRCLVGEDGATGEFEIVESNPEGVFNEAAIAALQKWRFRPGILKDKAVKTWVIVPFTFELD